MVIWKPILGQFFRFITWTKLSTTDLWGQISLWNSKNIGPNQILLNWIRNPNPAIALGMTDWPVSTLSVKLLCPVFRMSHIMQKLFGKDFTTKILATFTKYVILAISIFSIKTRFKKNLNLQIYLWIWKHATFMSSKHKGLINKKI